MFTLFLISLVASALAAVLLALDARSRATAEVSGAVQIAQHVIRSIVRKTTTQPSADLLSLTLREKLDHLRHVDVSVIDGRTPQRFVNRVRENEMPSQQSDDTGAPEWFVDLISPQPESSEVPVYANGTRVATVLMTGRPRDEIAEAWTGLTTVGAVLLLMNIVMFVVLYVVIGRILKPLTGVSAGMRKLVDGHAEIRVPVPHVHELKEIATSFNHLSASLETLTKENSALFRELINVQEHERRRIAGELHDEAGPCLFGITASVATVVKYLKEPTQDRHKDALHGALEIGKLCERLKGLNRGILNSLYPMAAGHVTLRELITKLLNDFQRRHRQTRISFSARDIANSHGEELDLLIYRTIQECTSNALRHAKPKNVYISLRATGTCANGPVSVANGTTNDQGDKAINATSENGKLKIELRVADDGSGIPHATGPGFGLRTMRERVRSFGGNHTIRPNTPTGTIIQVIVPANPQGRAPDASRVY